MKNLIAISIFLSFIFNLNAQSRTLIGYDYETGIRDTIANVFMPFLNSNRSEFHVGDFNSSIGNLPFELDTTNLFQESQWTNKEPVHNNFNVDDFPFRTSARIYNIVDGELILNCSGSMIGANHLLTAAHCISYGATEISFDSVFVCPAYDKGEVNASFECQFVKKVYIFEDWSFWGEDFAVFEFEASIGNETGWISLGYDEAFTYKDELLHKFSYPNWPDLFFDYNGDTLYHSYGYADIFDAEHIGVTGAAAVPGESGSSIIHLVNGETYTSYGVVTWVDDMKHSRMEKEYYYPILEVLSRDITHTTNPNNQANDWTIYPNPINNQFTFSSKQDYPNELNVNVYDLMGKRLIKTKGVQGAFIDVSMLPKGTYLVRLIGEDIDKIFKVIKSDI